MPGVKAHQHRTHWSHKGIVAGTRLAAKGLKKVESDSDLVVIYHAATDQQKTLNWSNMGGWGRFGGMGSAQVDTVVTGQLKVDLADYKAKQFLWRVRPPIH